MDLLDRLLGHDHWATTQLLERSRDLTDAQLDQQFDIGHRTLRETYDHMIYVIDFWTSMMNGQPASHDRTTQSYDRSVPALIERHERFQAAFATAARRALDEQRLDETFVDHYDYRQSVGATIIQVALHNAQHRNEARHILERLGVSGLRGDFDPQEWEHATQRV
jgi:uncharacterized damage-inducible protein DinB